MRTFTDIDIDQERVVVTFAGSVEFHDIREMLYTSEKARVIAFPTLMDARRARSQLSLDDLARIREILVELGTRSRLGPCAVVVSDAGSQAMVAASTQVFAGLVAVGGFLDRDEAERWLGWEAKALSSAGA